MAGQSGCHIWPAMLTQSDFSNPTQIRQIVGVCEYFYGYILYYEEKWSKIVIINDFKILHNFTDLRSKMLFVWQ